MEREIKRKFLILTLPILDNLRKQVFERYFLVKTGNIEIRVQRIDNRFEIERVENSKTLIRNIQTLDISQSEFEVLKQFSIGEIQRDCYTISREPEIIINIYHGRHEGFARVEVAFANEECVKSFSIPEWFGKEITNTPLARDGKLLELTREEFLEMLKEIS